MHGYEKREEALVLRRTGMTYEQIARQLSLPRNTVKSWGRRYGEGTVFDQDEESDVAELPESIELIPLPQAGECHVYLVSGPYHFRGKYDSFLSKIPESVGHRIAHGDIFVFCQASRRQISVLQWQGDGFAMMFRRTEQVRYPWPASSEVRLIEISREDLETLLSYPQFMRRLSGLFAPGQLA
ncbi:IS66 family insertion sequence element accessory protein TnpB [Eubacteriales bacterium OttesenSCG-928-N13]|nr:IS66 family insertion sequence element accessory protein TnpB [Eubacteriales bacterium OttesenSCG-928-N13]